ncbi:MAG: HNH endonuclease [Vulcanimicrobiota bacterium]
MIILYLEVLLAGYYIPGKWRAMPEPRKYPLPDIKLLYGLAGARCAFPNCRTELIIESSAVSGKKQIGEIAHIVGHSENGPRSDHEYPREKLDTYENWILLCPTCHTKIDAMEHTYSVAELGKLKEDHEQWVRASLSREITGVTFAELEVISLAIMTSASIPSEDFSVIPPAEKMIHNNLTSQVSMLLTMGISKSKEVHNYLQHTAIVDSQFPERLKAGFVNEYKRLRNEGIFGDALFESLRFFSTGGSADFTRQAAGLAVLAYLFECCEVFEK